MSRSRTDAGQTSTWAAAPERPPRGVSAVRDALMDLILDRELRPGDALPTEAELITALGVSRNSLREAVKGLQALGIVEIHHGSGTYVAGASVYPLLGGLAFRGRMSLRHDKQDAKSLLQVRQALETSLIGRAISLARPDDIARARTALESMETLARKGEPLEDADSEYHRSLFLPLGNHVLSELLEAFWRVYHEIAEDIGEKDANPVATARAHRDIQEAMERRDPQAATRAMEQHFEGIQRRLDDGTGSPDGP